MNKDDRYYDYLQDKMKELGQDSLTKDEDKWLVNYELNAEAQFEDERGN